MVERTEFGRAGDRMHLVKSEMNEHARKIFDQARETLARIADVKVEHREHRDDGLLSEHSVSMPPARRASPGMTDAEVANMIAATVAEQVDAKIAANDRIWEDVVGKVIGDLRRQLRAEFAQQLGSLNADATIAKAHRSGEFFYTDETGRKRDAELHGPILRAVDCPIDEKMMAPIRARNRAKWLDQQQRARRRG